MLFQTMFPASLYFFHRILANVCDADLLQSLSPCVKMMVDVHHMYLWALSWFESPGEQKGM